MSKEYYFKCNCELCQKEAINNDDDERYEKFENLQQEAKHFDNMIKQQADMFGKSGISPWAHFCQNKMIENIKRLISCYKEMYELAQNSKEPSRFMPYYFDIIILVIGDGFNKALDGYLLAKKNPGSRPDVIYFKDECQNFSKIGLQMSEIMCGSNSVLTKKWKERNDFESIPIRDLEQWMAQDRKLWSKFY